MKLCNKCNNAESDSARFCSNCGSSDFIQVHQIKDKFGNPLVNSADFDKDTQKEQKSRKQKMLSFIGVLIILMLVLLIFFFIKTSLDAKNSNQRETNNYSIDYSIPYTSETNTIQEK